MPTQGERQDYMWKPNDNGSTTRLRYDLEAEHWMRAFNNAAQKNKPADLGNFFGVIGLFLSLILNVLWIITILISRLFAWVRSKK